MQARMLDCHDILMALIPLVESLPWQRKRTRSGKPMVGAFSILRIFSGIFALNKAVIYYLCMLLSSWT
jgi:hypothetical protein